MKSGTLHQILNPVTVNDQKLKFLNSRWRRFFGHKSSTDCPISAKLFQNPTWPTAAILKIVKSPYLSEKSSDFDKIW